MRCHRPEHRCGTNTSKPPDSRAHLVCPMLNIQPFSACPMHYTIAQLNGVQLSMAVPTCSASTRPTDFSSAVGQLTRFMPFDFRGLWQTPCTWDATNNIGFSSELQVGCISSFFVCLFACLFCSFLFLYFVFLLCVLDSRRFL